MCSVKISLNELDFDTDDDTIGYCTNMKKFKSKHRRDKIKKSKKDITVLHKIPERSMVDYIFVDARNYHFKNWHECFPDMNVNLRSLVFHHGWNDFFDMVSIKKYYKNMERILSDILVENKIIVPYAELLFNAFNILSPKSIQVVFIGQDPYPGFSNIQNIHIPEATGLSFSVPYNYPKPLSLNNIYQNLLDFGHIKKMPNLGCLSYWAIQGCLMINSAFTTLVGVRGAHRNIWKNFTNDLLNYINDTFENIVFVIWGKDAHMLCQNIDPNKHYIITSSHPSPLGFDKTFNGFEYGKVKNRRDRKVVVYPSFKSTDHFGKINKYLVSKNKKEILWDIF